MSRPTKKNLGKEAAAAAAINFVENGMKIGLGTGSTASYFITKLAEKCRQGLRIEAVATSETSFKLAKDHGIQMIDINTLASLDLAVDGADEIDQNLRLIKGGGGALFREKIVASMSKKFIVIADESKRVQHLGKFPLAVEILPFGWKAIQEKLKEKDFLGKMRKSENGQFFVTDNGNFIIDISLSFPCKNPEQTDENIKSVTGVLETGFFFNTVSSAIMGFTDGHTETIDS
jgi:ribose 5-phosphate isomerase A